MRTSHPRASTLITTVALCSFACFAVVPRSALADEQPLDPYGPAGPRTPSGRPLDPYAPGALQPPPGPTLPIAAPPSVPPPLPVAPPPPGPVDPYAAPQGGYGGDGQPPPAWAPPPAPRPYGFDGCGVPGCGTAPSALPVYQPRSPLETEKRPRYGVMAAGLSILGGLWVISMSSGILAERYELAIPIAGPILTATDLNHKYERSPGLSFLTGLLVVDAMFQTVGLIMAIAGGASRVAVTKRRPYTQPSVYPAFSPYGVGVGGRF